MPEVRESGTRSGSVHIEPICSRMMPSAGLLRRRCRTRLHGWVDWSLPIVLIGFSEGHTCISIGTAEPATGYAPVSAFSHSHISGPYQIHGNDARADMADTGDGS